jgi:SAM-dependent methyltransferase
LKDFHPPPAKVLDAGAGDMLLLNDLLSAGYDAVGYDVDDFNLQSVELRNTDRVRIIADTDPWPYEDGSIDVVISNQVLEHVRDHDFFFENHARVLREGGRGLHVFPVREVFWEFHLNIPLAHKFRDFDRLHRYLRRATRLGLGKYSGEGLDEWCERHADYIWRLTNYRTLKEIYILARKHGLRASVKYTPSFYGEKLRFNRLLTGGAWPWKYLSCVTVTLEKKRSY